MVLRWFRTRLSKDFMITDIRAMGLKSLKSMMVFFWDQGDGGAFEAGVSGGVSAGVSISSHSSEDISEDGCQLVSADSAGRRGMLHQVLKPSRSSASGRTSALPRHFSASGRSE